MERRDEPVKRKQGLELRGAVRLRIRNDREHGQSTVLGIDWWRVSQNNTGFFYQSPLFLTYHLDLRKKLDLIQTILKHRGINEHKTFSQAHELHSLRNVIVHHFFEEEGDDRLSCDYLGTFGETVFSKLGTAKTDNSITFAEFDSYNAIASELHKKLHELLQSATPVTEIGDELREAMEEVIDSSIH